jgi:hypothetical protein
VISWNSMDRFVAQVESSAWTRCHEIASPAAIRGRCRKISAASARPRVPAPPSFLRRDDIVRPEIVSMSTPICRSGKSHVPDRCCMQ